MSEVNQEQLVQEKTKQFWTNDEVDDLLNELERVMGMMSPYYSQCNGDSSAQELLRRMRKKQDLVGPHFEQVYQAASCSVCNQSFGLSSKNKVMDEHQQHSMAMQHIKEVHGVEDYKERRQMIVKSHYILVEFEHRQAYLDSLNVKKK